MLDIVGVGGVNSEGTVSEEKWLHVKVCVGFIPGKVDFGLKYEIVCDGGFAWSSAPFFR